MDYRPRGGFFFFFNDTATTEIYTLSLHDALPILKSQTAAEVVAVAQLARDGWRPARGELKVFCVVDEETGRSEEHTSELQSRQYLVCRLLLEKKNKTSLHFHRTIGLLPKPRTTDL